MKSGKADSISANMLDEGKLRHKRHNDRGISRRGREGVQEGGPAGKEGVEGGEAARRGTETEVMKEAEPAGTPGGDSTAREGVQISTAGADSGVRRGEGGITKNVPATKSRKGQSLIRGKTSVGETAGSSSGGQVREDIREAAEHRKRGATQRRRTTRRTMSLH
jgi:hypothetical protein